MDPEKLAAGPKVFDIYDQFKREVAEEFPYNSNFQNEALVSALENLRQADANNDLVITRDEWAKKPAYKPRIGAFSHKAQDRFVQAYERALLQPPK